jgi:hypothetical protein
MKSHFYERGELINRETVEQIFPVHVHPILKNQTKMIDIENIRREHIIATIIAITCILIGYLITIVNGASDDLFKESTTIKTLNRDARNLKTLNEKIKNNPDLLKTQD